MNEYEYALTIAAALLIAGPVTAQTVQGTVFDSVARKPLTNAAISLAAVNALGAAVRTATSDSLGHYSIGDVKPGTYLLGFVHPVADSLGIEASASDFVPAASCATPRQASHWMALKSRWTAFPIAHSLGGTSTT